MSEIQLEHPPSTSAGMARPSSREAASNAAADDYAAAAAPAKGLGQRMRENFVACFWECEEHLADIFGLNNSKYQWAVDQYFEEKRDKEDRAAFEAEEEETRLALEQEQLAKDADKLEGGLGDAETVSLTSNAAGSSSEGNGKGKEVEL